jgi:iron complex transport system ATP-binding protein
MTPTEVLLVEHLCLRQGQVSVVEDVSFSVYPGELLCVVGPNGAGKSSLLKGILGLSQLHTGRISVLGRPLGDWSCLERARVMAYVPQQSALDVDWTVDRVVGMGRFAHAGGRSRGNREQELVAWALRECGALHLETRRYLSLSGGEQSMVLIARALATEAPLMLLDEPTRSLDVRHTLECHQLLRKLRDCGRSLLVVTHDINQLRTLADRVLLLKAGRALALGSPNALFRTPVVEKAFEIELVPCAAYGYAPRQKEETRLLCTA